jgi:ADP-ribose pyrophosphatase YjhB (NUDIX family)
LITRKEAPKRGYLGLPGGFVGHGETLEEALGREIQEELNLAIKDFRYFGSFPNRYDYKRVTYFTIDALFICRAVSLRSMKPRRKSRTLPSSGRERSICEESPSLRSGRRSKNTAQARGSRGVGAFHASAGRPDSSSKFSSSCRVK